MKKYFLLSLNFMIIFALILGCSSMQVKQEVNGNTFVSSYPKVTFKVNPEFKYIGDPNEVVLGTSVGGSREHLRLSRQAYCFVKADKDQAAQVVNIEIKTAETYWSSNLYGSVKNAVAKGTTEIGGKKFHYFTIAIMPSMNGYLTRYITGQGYKMSYGILTVYGRRYGSRNDKLVEITYYESLDHPEFYNSSWKNVDNLTHKQIEYLKNFNRRANSAFDLIS